MHPAYRYEPTCQAYGAKSVCRSAVNYRRQSQQLARNMPHLKVYETYSKCRRHCRVVCPISSWRRDH